MTTAYAKAIALSRDENGVRHGELDPGWYTARGAFGGLVAAQMMRAMIDELGEPDCFPRSLTVHFAAPPTGKIEIATEVVRGGKRVKHLAARYSSEGQVACFGSASFGKQRPDAPARYQIDQMPVFDPPERFAPVPTGGRLPPFLSHFDVRYCSPTLPYSGAKEPTFASWIRLVDPPPFDAAVIALFLDLLPPAVCATFDTWRAAASVDFTVQLFSHEPYDLDPSKHLLITIRSRWAGDGYAEEMRDLWSPEGRLLGQCRQVVAVI